MYYIVAETNYPTVFTPRKKFLQSFLTASIAVLETAFCFLSIILGQYFLYWVTNRLDQHVLTICPLSAHCQPTVCPLCAHCVPTVCPPCAQYVSPFLPIICPLCTQYMSPFLPIVCLACAPLPVCSDRTCFPFLLNIRCTKQKHIFELKLLSLLQDWVFYPIITQSPRLYNFLCSKQYV